jgi:membrane protein DedA with SNARE-associated domain
VAAAGNLVDMTSLTTYVTSVDSTLVTVLVTLLVFAETATLVGMVLPSETVVLLAGGLAATGTVSAGWLLPLTILAAIAGDCTAWLVGRRLGGRVRGGRLGRLVGERRWSRTDAVLDRHGSTTVVAARWVGVVRTIVPLLAGASRMPFGRFLVADVTACVLWGSGIVTVGYLGAAAVLTSAWTWPLVLVAAATAFVVHRRRSRVVRLAAA